MGFVKARKGKDGIWVLFSTFPRASAGQRPQGGPEARADWRRAADPAEHAGGTKEPAPLKGAFSKKSNYTKFLVLSLFAHILDARNDTKRQFCKRAISGRALIAVRAQARLFGKTPQLGC